jgi:hypothetical protein
METPDGKSDRGVWLEIRRAFDAAKPCRLAFFVTLLIPVVFVQVEQAAEILRCLAEGPAHTGGIQAGRFLFLTAGLTAMSLASWYFSRILLYFKFADSPPITPSVEWVMRWLPRFIGIMPSVGLGIAFLLAARVYDDPARAETKAVLYRFAAACFGIAIPFSLFILGRQRFMLKKHGASPVLARQAERIHALPRATKLAAGTSLLASTILFLSFLIEPVAVAQAIGSGAVILMAATFWICHGSMVIYFGHRYQMPVITLFLLVAVVFSNWNDNHAIRSLPGDNPAARDDLETYYASWYSNLCVQFPQEKQHPVIIVATAGGGIRAAYWTATVLGRLQDANPNFSRHVLAISGVSGGSLGAAVFDSLLLNGTVTNLTPTSQRILSRDFLSPTLAYMLFPDQVQRLLPFPISFLDRSRALEMAWEASWTRATTNKIFSQDFNALWPGDRSRSIPALFLNGTSVETGKRMILSNVKIERLSAPIAVSTAAHMSARFTYVSPAGRFASGERIVDGGYFENSGTATASDILDIVQEVNEQQDYAAYPIIIIISNDPGASTGAKTNAGGQAFLSELLAPVQAFLHTREARGSYSEVGLILRTDLEPTNVFTFTLTGARTNRVPLPLGWALSQAATSVMNDQMNAQTENLLRVIQHLPPP